MLKYHWHGSLLFLPSGVSAIDMKPLCDLFCYGRFSIIIGCALCKQFGAGYLYQGTDVRNNAYEHMLENDNLKIDLHANFFIQKHCTFYFILAHFCRQDAFIHITIESPNIRNVMHSYFMLLLIN